MKDIYVFDKEHLVSEWLDIGTCYEHQTLNCFQE